MRNPLFSRLPSSNRPRDKLITYYLWCFDKRVQQMNQVDNPCPSEEFNASQCAMQMGGM